MRRCAEACIRVKECAEHTHTHAQTNTPNTQNNIINFAPGKKYQCKNHWVSISHPPPYLHGFRIIHVLLMTPCRTLSHSMSLSSRLNNECLMVNKAHLCLKLLHLNTKALNQQISFAHLIWNNLKILIAYFLSFVLFRNWIKRLFETAIANQFVICVVKLKPVRLHAEHELRIRRVRALISGRFIVMASISM